MVITDEEIEKNKEMIIKLLRKTERKNIDILIDKLERSDFFTAPASKIYHLNCKGGLAYHSLSVCRTLNKLAKTFHVDIPSDTIIIAGLLHDVCKINLYKYDNARHKYVTIGSQKEHGILSVERVKKTIELTEQEELMIRWHMGRYTWDGNFEKMEDKLKAEHPEVYLMYFADHISTLFVEE